MGPFDPADFEIVYPGVYAGREAEPVAAYFAANKAIEDRGEIDTEALAAGTLPADTPGLGPKLEVTEAMVRYNNAKYDPDNRLLNDADYARSLGYKDIPAMPCYGAHDDTFMVPYPPDARDTLLVSQLNHSVTNYAPGVSRRHSVPGQRQALGHRPHRRPRAPSTGTSPWPRGAPSTTSGARRSTTPPGGSPRA